MQIQAINNRTNVSSNNMKKNPNFGHTFRVSICTINKDGAYTYVSPAKNTKLYKKLNRKIVSFLNEGFISKLRNEIGIPRKITKKKTQREVELQQNITKKLSEIDSDYKQANFVRSNYSKNTLNHIATGVDVPIIGDFVGANGLGVAKSLARKNNIPPQESGVREISKEFHKADKEYVNSSVNLLRSKDNKEIMLRANFNEIEGKRGGKPKYEMADFEFHEIKSKPLPPLKPEDESLKKNINLDWAVGRQMKHTFDTIYGRAKGDMKPKEALETREKFTNLISKVKDIKHDLPQ